MCCVLIVRNFDKYMMKFCLSTNLILSSITASGALVLSILLYKVLNYQHLLGWVPISASILIIISFVVPIWLLAERTQKLIRSSEVDELTGLYNRATFIKRCESIIKKADSKNDRFDLMILDLNKFKQINGTVGHQIGDQLLKIVSNKLVALVQPGDEVCRFGGDEFALLIRDVRHSDVYKTLATDIVNSISDPSKIDSHWLYTSTNVGIATYPESGTTFLELMRCADIAMYRAKKMQKDYVLYDFSDDKNSVTDLTLIGELRSAIADEDFVLYFQPKKNLKTGEITSIESLVRWKHPLKGIIPPASFISLAESTGMIKYLTQYVIKEAAQAYRTLKDAGYDLKIAVNVSPNDIVDPAIMTTIIKSIVKAEMPPNKFVLEVTETAIMHEPEAAFRVLVALDSLGIQLSIDDFGTGHSSLLYLKNFPIDEVKLDRSFIVDIEQSKEGHNIVKSTIDLAHLLNAHTVAEGVETVEIESILDTLGCDEIQGYYIARPMPLSDLIEWLGNYKGKKE